ncbi:MAG TPA: hypothetical protein VM781_01975 [Candidatus Bathyarchaeia archaeon]|nr:hypothetical protein [Candidatus Bathyarchaeia archaeon]
MWAGKLRQGKEASNDKIKAGEIVRGSYCHERRQKHRWRKHAAAIAALGYFLLGSCPAMFAQCNSLKAGDKLWVRLLEPLSSYSGKPGDKIHAMVIESPACEGSEVIPAGTTVAGEIVKARKVGLDWFMKSRCCTWNFAVCR